MDTQTLLRTVKFRTSGGVSIALRDENYVVVADLSIAADGEINSIYVYEAYRRRGLATQLFMFAQETEGIPSPLHSQYRSSEGDAWAKAVGGNLPTLYVDAEEE